MSTRKVLSVLAAIGFAVAVSIPVLHVSDADARSFGGGRSFSSSSFSRSSFRSSSVSSSRRPTGSFWGSKTSSPSIKPVKTVSYGGTKTVKTSSFQTVRTGVQTRSAKLALNRQHNQFKKPAYTSFGANSKTSQVSTATYKTRYGNNGVYSRASSYNRSTYFTRRSHYYSGYHAPAYVYNMSPSYGLWDTLFLYSMMNNMSNASAFAYNHQHDADYLAWRQAADEQARTNADLRAQLATMDAKVSGMTGKVDPNYLPKGVDADIALSQEAIASQKPVFRACVGGESGAYYRIVTRVLGPDQNDVTIVPVVTSGSREALENIVSGKCDGGFVQGDSYWNYVEHHQTTNLPFIRVFSPFKEAAHLICNSGSNVKTVDDLTNANKVYFPTKSGAAETWANLVAEDNDYKKIQTPLNNPLLTVDTNEDAFAKAATDRNSCAMFVGAPAATQFMNNVERAAIATGVVLVALNESTFDSTVDPSGAKVYTFGKFTNKQYPKLLRKAGVLGTSYFNSIDTLFVNADFLVSDAWKKQHKRAFTQFSGSLYGMTGNIATTVSQQH